MLILPTKERNSFFFHDEFFFHEALRGKSEEVIVEEKLICPHSSLHWDNGKKNWHYVFDVIPNNNAKFHLNPYTTIEFMVKNTKLLLLNILLFRSAGREVFLPKHTRLDECIFGVVEFTPSNSPSHATGTGFPFRFDHRGPPPFIWHALYIHQYPGSGNKSLEPLLLSHHLISKQLYYRRCTCFVLYNVSF